VVATPDCIGPRSFGALSDATPLDGKRSPYCRVGEAEEALDSLVRGAKAQAILMSYNSEGLVPQERIVAILSQRGKVEVYVCEYRRFRSDADGDNRRYGPRDTVQEMLYWVGG